MSTRRPLENEYNEYYHGYLSKVPDGNIIHLLDDQRGRFQNLLSEIPDSKINFRYAEGKWTSKEVVGHVLDAEWVFTYRALRIARADKTPLAGMDQDEFASGTNVGERHISSLTLEFGHLRSASIELFSSFDEKILDRSGTASGYAFTVRALVYIIAGHAEHHMAVLRERYL